MSPLCFLMHLKYTSFIPTIFIINYSLGIKETALEPTKSGRNENFGMFQRISMQTPVDHFPFGLKLVVFRFLTKELAITHCLSQRYILFNYGKYSITSVFSSFSDSLTNNAISIFSLWRFGCFGFISFIV